LQFLVRRVLGTVVGPDDARVQCELGPEIQRIMASERVEASGAFAGTRGDPPINTNAPEDIYNG
jgi:hypothetical protein